MWHCTELYTLLGRLLVLNNIYKILLTISNTLFAWIEKSEQIQHIRKTAEDMVKLKQVSDYQLERASFLQRGHSIGVEDEWHYNEISTAPATFCCWTMNNAIHVDVSEKYRLTTVVEVCIQDWRLVPKDYPLDKSHTAHMGRIERVKMDMSFISLMDTIKDSGFFLGSW